MKTIGIDYNVSSPACDAVISALHPAPSDGGPCATCAFRQGTQANQSDYTMALARLCVEGLTPFHCHEQPQLCRGFVAAVNLRGVPETENDKRWCEVARCAAEMIAACIHAAKAEQDVATTMVVD